MNINHMPSIRSVLCALVLRQYSIALVCLHKHYVFGMQYVSENQWGSGVSAIRLLQNKVASRPGYLRGLEFTRLRL